MVVVVGTGLSASQNVLALARIAAAVGTVSAESADTGEPPEIDAVIVTEHALCTPGDSSAADLSHAGLVGARRALYNEQPRILWRLIDVESATPSEDLIREVLNGAADNGEQVDEVCLRMGSRFVTRVRRNLADLPRGAEPATLAYRTTRHPSRWKSPTPACWRIWRGARSTAHLPVMGRSKSGWTRWGSTTRIRSRFSACSAPRNSKAPGVGWPSASKAREPSSVWAPESTTSFPGPKYWSPRPAWFSVI